MMPKERDSDKTQDDQDTRLCLGDFLQLPSEIGARGVINKKIFHLTRHTLMTGNTRMSLLAAALA